MRGITEYGAEEFPFQPDQNTINKQTTIDVPVTTNRRVISRSQQHEKRVSRAQWERDKANLDMDQAVLDSDQAKLDRDHLILERDKAVFDRDLLRAEREQEQRL